MTFLLPINFQASSRCAVASSWLRDTCVNTEEILTHLYIYSRQIIIVILLHNNKDCMEASHTWMSWFSSRVALPYGIHFHHHPYHASWHFVCSPDRRQTAECGFLDGASTDTLNHQISKKIFVLIFFFQERSCQPCPVWTSATCVIRMRSTALKRDTRYYI